MFVPVIAPLIVANVVAQHRREEQDNDFHPSIQKARETLLSGALNMASTGAALPNQDRGEVVNGG